MSHSCQKPRALTKMWDCRMHRKPWFRQIFQFKRFHVWTYGRIVGLWWASISDVGTHVCAYSSPFHNEWGECRCASPRTATSSEEPEILPTKRLAACVWIHFELVVLAWTVYLYPKRFCSATVKCVRNKDLTLFGFVSFVSTDWMQYDAPLFETCDEFSWLQALSLYGPRTT